MTKYVIQKVEPDDGSFHGPVTYLRVDTSFYISWEEHAAHASKVQKYEAVAILLALRAKPENTEYGECSYSIESSNG